MKNILEYLEETGRRFPEKTGFTDAERTATFAEAIHNARAIGSALNGIKRNSPVAVVMDKNVRCIESMLGVVYAGCFYVVIDVHSPADRVEKIFETLSPVAIVTDRESFDFASGFGASDKILVYEDAVQTEINETFLAQVRSYMVDTDPLYVLFTSGSTGTPKGAVLSHRSVMSYTDWVSGEFGFNENTSFGSQTPLYFSMSVTDLFSTLKCGCTFNILPKAYFTFPVKLVEYMNLRKVNTIYWVPSAIAIISNWDVFQYIKPEYLEKVLFAGEVMPVKHLNYWRRHFPDCLYANLFGPTETTDICTFYVVDREFEDSESLPIGRACDNCDVFIVREDGSPASPGEEGELLVRGSFLADGYYNNPDKTEAAFTQNPLNSAYPERVYRTGDLARVNENGEIIYVTRKDFQIKRMGYRIELGEIEAAVNSFESIKSCVALYDMSSSKLYVVYDGKVKDTDKVMNAIRGRVPAYMCPDKVIRVKQMPHNSNGKIDRNKLKAELVSC